MNRLIATGARTVARRTYSSSAAAANISAGELSAVLEERISNYGKEATASVDEIGKGKYRCAGYADFFSPLLSPPPAFFFLLMV